jgi:hypothetical protein
MQRILWVSGVIALRIHNSGTEIIEQPALISGIFVHQEEVLISRCREDWVGACGKENKSLPLSENEP